MSNACVDTGAWQWTIYTFVSELAKVGKLISIESSQSQSFSGTQDREIGRDDEDDDDASTQGHGTYDVDGPDISFTWNDDGDKEPVVVSQDESISQMVRNVLAHFTKVIHHRIFEIIVNSGNS